MVVERAGGVGGLYLTRRWEQRSAIAVRQVCRQLRYETQSVLFKYVSFEFGVGIPRAINIARLNIELYNAIQSIVVDPGNSHVIHSLSKSHEKQKKEFLDYMSCGRLPSLKHVCLRLSGWDHDHLDFVRRIFGNQGLQRHLY